MIGPGAGGVTTITAAVGNTPAPVKLIVAVALVAGNTAALWVILKLPDTGPTTTGLNISDTLQLLAGAIEALALNTQGGSTAMVTAGVVASAPFALTGTGMAGAMENSGLLMLIEPKLSGALPLLVIVSTCGGLTRLIA